MIQPIHRKTFLAHFILYVFLTSQGVSAAFSAPLLASIPVTHRGVSNQVVMCTGYGREGTSPDLIQYHKEQTIVFLMAVGRLRELCQNLIEKAGYPSNTPVAIVERAGCPDQRTVVGDMTTIAELSERHKIRPPSTIIVGEVVNVLLDENEESGVHVTGLIQNYTSIV
jgi:siroheme synthase